MRDTPDPAPLDAPALAPPAPRGAMCTDCGLSRMALAPRCGTACQFTVPDFPARERAAHGRTGGDPHVGPHLAMHRAAMEPPRPGAQWTGITTALAQSLLETGTVTAVLTLAPAPDDPFEGVPVIVTDPADMARVRGMRMGFSPLLALLEPAAAQGHRRIALIGVPCQVHALRAIEAELGLERLYVIGTPCSDNTTLPNFHDFLARLTDRPGAVTYLEFRADYRVEMRFDDGAVRMIPFLKLPLSDLPDDFFPLTCRTCTDYTNRLADITVGYMGGDGDQWVIVRNARGAEMLAGLGDAVRLGPLSSRGKRRGAVAGFAANTARAAGGLPLRRMPGWLRPIVAWLQPRLGPRGMEFARARLEMKAVECILHLRRAAPGRMKHMIPDHVWRLAAPYGLAPRDGERQDSAASASSDQPKTP
ncbi:Coenzyme F420 hydrogenase/dehydrogenase, beta subunit C-terminal domain [Jannaschia ovalis]|uniref:Coenzyme F420 hydrogenase/dehydrogenase, beta subunit C-terminal domain n=1 Tax=Jannaschia ovalis TaxID=3038773 RepID=A0ABY8L7R0_9RHOB|nr:Coenzyme F420 hydrogenase/dehydrogenase, beta subunit C-terminal domain [Jannaschia sp. GRR-S6-38]WGH77408.1 Coenzyme F420 hydrogenase/dehydrogenase, beta subunit C-terminal domain [Jannaschia sp. GRR-S6-38]